MQRYKTPIISIALVALLLGFYWNSIASIVDIWIRSETYAHGFLILPISIYMIWLGRDDLKSVQISSSWAGLLYLILATTIWTFAYAGNVLTVEQIAVYLFIPALLYSVYGLAALKALAFPVAYLIFAIPFGEELIPVLQDFTAYFTVKALQLTGIPVYWEGLFITIPTGNFEVAKACSGIRYLFASLALGTFYAYISYGSYLKRFIFILFSIIVPLVANGLRAYGIVIIAHLSENRYATGVDHIVYGWLFFGIIMFVLFWLGSYWRDSHVEKASHHEAKATESLYSPSIIIIALIILSIGPVVTSWIKYKENQVIELPVYTLPDNINGWVRSENFPHGWDPVFIGADEKILASYKKQNDYVYVIVYRYARQKQGEELINSLNNIYDGKNWRLVDYSYETKYEQPVIQEKIRGRNGDLLAWRWYQINNINIANKYVAKAIDAYMRLFKNETSYVYVIATDVKDDSGQELMRLQNFVLPFKQVITNN